MTNETILYLSASILAFLALIFNTAFIYRMARRSPWSASTPGRTLMLRAVGMWLIYVYAFVVRWFDPPTAAREWLGLGIFALLALIELRLVLMLEYIQTGKVTTSHPNYTPFRTWLARHRREKV